MSVEAWPDGVGCIVLAEIDSTNTEATRIAGTVAGPTWILAHRQTAGRGRRGRTWAMPRGNFAATLVMRPGGSAADAALRSFVAALALWDAFAELGIAESALALKWPNDVLLNGGKVAGILLESFGNAVGVQHLAVGIGVNLADAPDAGEVEQGALVPVSLRRETGLAVSPEDFLDALAPAFARWDRHLVTYGFEPIRDAWLSRAARLGDLIKARTGTTTHTGVFETIDATGAIVLRTPAGRVVLPAADVQF